MLPHGGKVVLVAGAMNDVGLAVARTFAAQGADLIIWDTERATAQASGRDAGLIVPTTLAVARLGRSTGCRIVTSEVDVRDQDALDAAVLNGLDVFGHIDVAVAVADPQLPLGLVDSTDKDWQALLDASLSSVWRVAKAVIPHMMQRRNGALLVTTTLSIREDRGAASSAAGHGLHGLVQAMARELAQYDIGVNSVMYDVAPANEEVLDPIGTSSGAPTSDEVASVVAWLASEAAHSVTGVEVPVKSGRFTADLYV